MAKERTNLSTAEVVSKLRALNRAKAEGHKAGGNTPTATAVAPPRDDVKPLRLPSGQILGYRYEIPALMRQRDSAPIITRTRGRLGEGERLMAPAPRLGNRRQPAITIKLAEFTRNGTIRRGQCVTVETVSVREFNRRNMPEVAAA